MGIQPCDCRVSGDLQHLQTTYRKLTSSFLSPVVGISSANTGSVTSVEATNADEVPMNARRVFVASSAVWVIPLLFLVKEEDAIEKAVASRAINARAAPRRNSTRENMMHSKLMDSYDEQQRPSTFEITRRH